MMCSLFTTLLLLFVTYCSASDPKAEPPKQAIANTDEVKVAVAAAPAKSQPADARVVDDDEGEPNMQDLLKEGAAPFKRKTETTENRGGIHSPNFKRK